MRNVGQTLPLRQLGRRLTEWRDRAGYSLDQAAEKIPGLSRSALGRLEKGQKAKPNPRDIEAICKAYGMPADLTRGCVGLALQAPQKNWWWHAYNDLIPANFDVYMSQEAASSAIVSYQPNLIPGLLQTPDYMRELIRLSAPQALPGEVERRVELKTHRKTILTRPDPVTLDVIIGQAALHHVVGSRALMADQLRHLTEVTALHTNITLRILPFDAGFPCGDSLPQVVMLDFPPGPDGHPLEPRTVFLENVRGGIYLESAEDIAFYDNAIRTIGRASKSPSDSQIMLTRIAKEYERDR